MECAVKGCAKEVFPLVFAYLFDTCDDETRKATCDPEGLMEACGFVDSGYIDVFEGFESSDYPQWVVGMEDHDALRALP
jgi:hypothetical protein